MPTLSAALTTRYADTLNDVIATIAPLDAAALAAPCAAEQCTVAALACHLAAVHGNVAGFVQTIVVGEALPSITEADLDRMNAENAAENAGLSKAEVLARLRSKGETFTSTLQGLRDEDLERTAPFTLFGGDVSVQALVESAVLEHTADHLASIQAAVRDAASTTRGERGAAPRA